MTNRFYSPYPQFFDSTPTPRAGARLFFYAAGTSTKQNTYSNTGLSIANDNPLTLNALGQPDTDIYLSDLPYKIVLAPSGSDDPPNSALWTGDNFYIPATTAKFNSGSGDPNGSVAGTAGSVGVPVNVYWDYVGHVLYACTTTGTSSTAVWTAITSQASAPPGSDGTVSAPAYSFSADPDTGIYRIGSNNIGIALQGTKYVDLSTSSINVANNLTVATNKFTVAASSGDTAVAGTFSVTGATTLSAALTYGGVTLANSVTGTGSMVLSASPTLTGTLAAAAGTFSSTLGVTGNATVGGTFAVTSDFAVATNKFTVAAASGNTLIAGTLGLTGTLTAAAATFSGVVTHSSTTTLSGALTYGGVALSNAVTGTGNMVLSAGPTLTGTLTAVTATFSGVVTHSSTTTLSGALTYGGVALSNSVTGTGSMVLSASPTFTGAVTSPSISIGDASPILNMNGTVNGPEIRFKAVGVLQSSIQEPGGTAPTGGVYVWSDGTGTIGVQLVRGANSWASVSDKRLAYKRDARELSGSLPSLASFKLYENDVNGRPEIFVKAQEVNHIFPHIVYAGEGDEDYIPTGLNDPKAWRMAYDRLGAIALAYAKQHEQRLDALEKKVH